MIAFMRSITGFRCPAPMNRGTTNGLGEGLRKKRHKPLQDKGLCNAVRLLTSSYQKVKRRGQDSNLRRACTLTDLANPRFRPLSHLSNPAKGGELTILQGLAVFLYNGLARFGVQRRRTELTVRATRTRIGFLPIAFLLPWTIAMTKDSRKQADGKPAELDDGFMPPKHWGHGLGRSVGAPDTMAGAPFRTERSSSISFERMSLTPDGYGGPLLGVGIGRGAELGN